MNEKMSEYPPKKIWLIYPSDTAKDAGDPPTLWLEPCPFPIDDGEMFEYELSPPEPKIQESDLAKAIRKARGS